MNRPKEKTYLGDSSHFVLITVALKETRPFEQGKPVPNSETRQPVFFCDRHIRTGVKWNGETHSMTNTAWTMPAHLQKHLHLLGTRPGRAS